jgi:hypothetical protein
LEGAEAAGAEGDNPDSGSIDSSEEAAKEVALLIGGAVLAAGAVARCAAGAAAVVAGKSEDSPGVTGADNIDSAPNGSTKSAMLLIQYI